MLSYRHLYHAGNFADVHKHLAWIADIRALQKKPSAMCLFDVYAGAGSYDLSSLEAEKTREWQDGIGRLQGRSDAPESVRDYLHLLGEDRHRYPGSPLLGARCLREQDRLVCFELHPQDHALLKALFRDEPRVHVHRRDAREGLAALVPPRERRGLVLIDPPYERDAEYAEVPAMLKASLARWPTGSCLVWYPLLAAARHEQMLAALAALQPKSLFVHELRLPRKTSGLLGSGLAWLNPPWQVDELLGEAVDWAAALLDGRTSAKWLIQG